MRINTLKIAMAAVMLAGLVSISADAGEMSALVTPGIIRVNGDFFANEEPVFVTLTITDSTGAVVSSNTATVSEGAPHSEKLGGNSFDVTKTGDTVEFTLRLRDNYGVGFVANIHIDANSGNFGSTFADQKISQLAAPGRGVAPL